MQIVARFALHRRRAREHSPRFHDGALGLRSPCVNVRLPLAVGLAVLASVAAGCGGSASHAHEYPAGAETDFVTRCTSQPNSSLPGCECLYEELSKRIPYRRFVTVGPIMAIEGNVSGSDAVALQAAINTCAAKIEKGAGG